MKKKLPREYKIWSEMRQRCLNPKNPRWPSYGGRGIKICERWSKYANFLEDMGSPPTKEHTLDRINNNCGYEPANCRWATRQQQAGNTKKNVMITISGITACASAWARFFKVPAPTVLMRLRDGWEPEEAVRTPPRPHGGPRGPITPEIRQEQRQRRFAYSASRGLPTRGNPI